MEQQRKHARKEKEHVTDSKESTLRNTFQQAIQFYALYFSWENTYHSICSIGTGFSLRSTEVTVPFFTCTMRSAIGVMAQQAMNVARAEKYIQELQKSAEKHPQRINVGSFLNNLSQSLARIQSSGIPAVSERRETEDKIVLTITIPKG